MFLINSSVGKKNKKKCSPVFSSVEQVGQG